MSKLQRVNNGSPKGRFRMWQLYPFVLVSFIGIYLMHTPWGAENLPGWTTMVVKLTGAEAIGIVSYYWALRVINHFQTHHLPEIVPPEHLWKAQVFWGAVQALCVALIISFSISVSF